MMVTEQEPIRHTNYAAAIRRCCSKTMLIRWIITRHAVSLHTRTPAAFYAQDIAIHQRYMRG